MHYLVCNLGVLFSPQTLAMPGHEGLGHRGTFMLHLFPSSTTLAFISRYWLTSSTHKWFSLLLFKALQTNHPFISKASPSAPNRITSPSTGLITSLITLLVIYFTSSQDSSVNPLKWYAKCLRMLLYTFLSHSQKTLKT